MSNVNDIKIILHKKVFQKIQLLDNEETLFLDNAEMCITDYGNILLKFSNIEIDDIKNKIIENILYLLRKEDETYYYKRTNKELKDEDERFYISLEDEFIAQDFLDKAREE